MNWIVKMIAIVSFLGGAIASQSLAASTPSTRGDFCQKPNVCVSEFQCATELVLEGSVEKSGADELCAFKSPDDRFDIVRKADILSPLIPYIQYYDQEGADPLSAAYSLLYSFNRMTQAQMKDLMRCVRRFRAENILIFRCDQSCETLIEGWPRAKEDELYNCLHKAVSLGDDPELAMDKCIQNMKW